MQLKVLEKRQETKDSFSLIFEKPKGFDFYPGQFLDIGKIFSISSSPSEDFIMLTYKAGVSVFKKKLENIKKGDLISSSHPAGTVVIDDSSPIVMMAGGIGIAPHRSMLKYAVDQKLDLPITLIYSNSDEDFVFKNELDQWQKEYPNLTVHYVITSKDGRLTKDKLKNFISTFYILHSTFYLAGPPSLVDDFEKILLELGVDETSIRTDRFDGY